MKSISFILAGTLALSPVVTNLHATVVAEWDYSLQGDLGKGLDEIAATGTTAAGNTFNTNINAASKVVADSSGGYTYRIAGKVSSTPIALADLDLEAKPSELWYIVNSGGWDFTNASGFGSTLALSTLVNFELTSGATAGSAPLASFILNSKYDAENNKVIGLEYYTVGGWVATTVEFGLVESDVIFAMQYDLDNSTGTLYYSKDGGTVWASASTTALRNNNIPLNAKIVAQQRMEDGTYFDIDSIIVSTGSPIPEPSTCAMLVGLFALIHLDCQTSLFPYLA